MGSVDPRHVRTACVVECVAIATRKSSCKTLTSTYCNRSQIVNKIVYSMNGLIL